jgi:ABC-type transporter Mla subunit MlaD
MSITISPTPWPSALDAPILPPITISVAGDLHLTVVDNRAVLDKLQDITGALGRLGDAVTALQAQGAKAMAVLDAVKQLCVDIDAATNDVAKEVAEQAATIEDLKQQIAKGGTITEADLQPVADALNATSARLKQIAADPTNPVPTA